jgi:hypothetical protein
MAAANAASSSGGPTPSLTGRLADGPADSPTGHLTDWLAGCPVECVFEFMAATYQATTRTQAPNHNLWIPVPAHSPPSMGRPIALPCPMVVGGHG